MKTKILLTALASFFFLNVNAIHNSASLEINLKQQRNTLYIIQLENGVSYETEDFLHLDNLHSGLNRIKIFKQHLHRSRRSRGNVHDKLIFNGTINLPANSTVFSKLVHRKLIVKRIVRKRIKRPRKPRGNMRFGMNQRQFNDLIITVKQESFDSRKLKVMNMAIRQNNLSSRQVLQLMKLLTFDSYKLKLAKKAYAKTVDKQNYFIVRNGLTFSSHKRELTKFIKHKF